MEDIKPASLNMESEKEFVLLNGNHYKLTVSYKENEKKVLIECQCIRNEEINSYSNSFLKKDLIKLNILFTIYSPELNFDTIRKKIKKNYL